MIIIPTRGYILGEVLTEDRTTQSGIRIVGTLKKGIPPKRVRIIALGLPTSDKKYLGQVTERDGKKKSIWIPKLSKNGNIKEIQWHYKTGDVLHIKPHTGIPQTINGKKHLFLRRNDIIGYESV